MSAALYRVVDRRTDGSRRVVAELASPGDAAAHRDVLAAAGAAVDVEIVPADELERDLSTR